MLGLQHVVTLDIRLQHIAVAPPRGVRGLKYKSESARRQQRVAPPRGVRGLKFFQLSGKSIELSRTPSWGAWIEMICRWEHGENITSHPLVGCVD